jgi:hypothetical protein
MTRIVRTHYRYKRPPKRRKAVALEVPAIVKAADPGKARKRSRVSWGHDTSAEAELASPAANDDRKSAIITIRRKPERILPPGLLPETPEEHKRRGDGADALFRDIVQRIAQGRP